jgi:outer membrane protein
MRIKTNCFVLAVITLSLLTSAEEKKALSLTDVLRIASDSSISIHQARYQTLSREASARQATGSLLPSLSASVSTGKQADLRESTSSPTGVDAGLSLSYSLSAQSFYNREAANLSREAAMAAEEQARDDILLESAQSFLNVVSTGAAIDVEKANLEYEKSQLEQIEAFYQSGRKSVSDVLQQKTFVSEAQSRVLKAQYAFDLARMELQSLLGLPLEEEISFQDDEIWGISESISADSSLSPPESQKNVTISSIEAQQKTIEASRKSLRSAELANLPSLGISAGLSVDKRFSDLDRGINGPDGRVSLSLSIPIFDRLQRSTSVTRNEIELKSAQLRLEELKRQVRLSLERAMLEYRMAMQQTKVVNDRLRSAEQTLEAVKERYAAGAATLTEVSSVNSQFLEARLAQVEAQLQLVKSYFNILHKSGNIAEIIKSGNGSKGIGG